MATVKSLVESALKSIGVLAAGEQAQPRDLQDALTMLKQMLASWEHETLLIPALATETFEVSPQQEYTVGPGGDLDTTRPVQVFSLRTKDTNGTERMIKAVSRNIIDRQPIKDTVESYPKWFHYEPEYPLGRIMLSSTLQSGESLILVAAKPFADLPGLTEETEFPPGYERAIRLGLAFELAPDYGIQVSEVMATQYRQAISNLKRSAAASRDMSLTVDSALQMPRRYDINHGPE